MSIIMLSFNSCDDSDQIGSALAELALMAEMGGKLPLDTTAGKHQVGEYRGEARDRC